MGELFFRITVEHIQEVVQLSAGGHSMRTDIFEIKLPVEQYPVWNGQYDGTIGSWETVVLKENSPNFREK